jgi:hypothetical protein
MAALLANVLAVMVTVALSVARMAAPDSLSTALLSAKLLLLIVTTAAAFSTARPGTVVACDSGTLCSSK